MLDDLNNIGPKVHPVSREMLPEDPLELSGVEVDGDPELMLRLLVEEYARMGNGLDALMTLSRDPFYTGFHGLWRLLGEEPLKERIRAILARCGVVRVTTTHSQPLSERLVQITLPPNA
ncbi:MAG: hypothetical protein K8T91_05920 [Planctomycetes bacterium]|nr:hypothetical protein [Planctomycetota bacterium]